ncbi:hypothetical protein KFL_001380030 [Klebsormidium nitens]|uniref:Uncharacterized protein n=1 Tax=Klebsormidium nitens TaxID=105231 RepID=A0A1Y1I1V7_KLENI|nr:hypothetical protein KFL_001380030 [Klebsormidium nitens]|eukprot:GAQ83161.1 hypothetical protein KFL_001380030 [Klebsormidium nitens]
MWERCQSHAASYVDLLHQPVFVVELAKEVAAKSERRDRWRPSFAWLLALSLLLGDASALAPAAQAFPFFGPSQEKDPVEPFVIYGTVEKKFLIEKIEDGRIVGRKKGFTASVCAKCVGANAETPEFLGLPTGMKMEEAPGEQSCSKWEAASKDEVCAKPCKLSCDDAVARQVRLERASTGYELDPGDRQKALRGCAAACENECQKPGRSSAFVVPIRP